MLFETDRGMRQRVPLCHPERDRPRHAGPRPGPQLLAAHHDRPLQEVEIAASTEDLPLALFHSHRRRTLVQVRQWGSISAKFCGISNLFMTDIYWLKIAKIKIPRLLLNVLPKVCSRFQFGAKVEPESVKKRASNVDKLTTLFPFRQARNFSSN